ncbi:MAG: ABC transporter ATP-binding protein [Verrucomicrobia bacterium]|nr:ABC transporter ATP-binding protein [Verrucomicrobiota bacterium]MCH8526989.1 ATP-binding cassette domain-containing protein [Kiritimatiellia bacterium]
MNELSDELLLNVENLRKYFPVKKGILRRTAGEVKAVRDVSFEIKRGEILGLVGESGSGKTTTGRMILRAIDPTAGRILFRQGERVVDIAQLDKAGLREIRKDVQMIFQDPNSSLNPRMTVLELIAEPLRAHGWREKACRERVRELLDLVGLPPGAVQRFPHAFSGGQRQRIGIARALALSPSLIVADEPVSALDVSVQAQILNLLLRIRKEMNLTFLFVAHDLGVVRYLCDHVAVMVNGALVEKGETESLFRNPQHPYTRSLIDASPPPDPHADWPLFHQPEKESV